MNNIPWKCSYLESKSNIIFRACANLYSPECNTIVIFNPICEEQKSSFSVLTDLSKEFWKKGWTVVRFDYRGTGDSTGDFSTSTPDNWITDASTVIEKLPSKPNQMIFMGLRLGCNIAFSLSKLLPKNKKTKGLVFWEPILDIDAYIRHLKWTGHKTSNFLDVYGWKLSNQCLSQIPSTFKLDLKDINCPVFISNISGRKKISNNFEELKNFLPEKSKVTHIRSRPFWELIGQLSCDQLVAESCNWLDELINNE